MYGGVRIVPGGSCYIFNSDTECATHIESRYKELYQADEAKHICDGE